MKNVFNKSEFLDLEQQQKEAIKFALRISRETSITDIIEHLKWVYLIEFFVMNTPRRANS